MAAFGRKVFHFKTYFRSGSWYPDVEGLQQMHLIVETFCNTAFVLLWCGWYMFDLYRSTQFQVKNTDINK